MKIWVTRPEPEGSALAAKLARQGHEVTNIPLLTIEGRSPDLWRPLFLASMAENLIFVSKNAVRYFFAGALLDVKQTLWAVGPGTAQALCCHPRERGDPVLIKPVVFPENAEGSEAFLALPQLRSIKGQHFTIVSGTRGRDLICKTLRARGAEVNILAVYDVQNANLSTADEAALQQNYDLIIATSTSALRLIQQWNVDPHAMVSVLSKNMLDLAAQCGFQSFLLLKTGSDEEILKRVGEMA